MRGTWQLETNESRKWLGNYWLQTVRLILRHDLGHAIEQERIKIRTQPCVAAKYSVPHPCPQHLHLCALPNRVLVMLIIRHFTHCARSCITLLLWASSFQFWELERQLELRVWSSLVLGDGTTQLLQHEVAPLLCESEVRCKWANRNLSHP